MQNIVLDIKHKIENIIPIKGNRIILDEISIEDLLEIKRWIKKEPQEKITCRPIQDYSQEEELKKCKDFKESVSSYAFGIYEKHTGRITGRVTFFDYNSRNQAIEIGYFILPGFRNRGYAYEALQRAIKAVFESGINKIMAQTANFNTPSIMLLRKLNFQQDGILRQHHILDGVYYDDLVFSILKKEFIDISKKH